MKRSNRLVLLIGVFLAVIAFVGVLVLSQPDTGPGPDTPPTEATVVIAREDIPLGTVIDQGMVENRQLPINAAEADAYNDVSQVIGQVARQQVVAGAQITGRTTSGGTSGAIIDLDVPAGMRAMTIRVDQVTGVGTLIKAGDYVDMVVRMKIPPARLVEIDPVWDTTSKLLIQGVQVLGVQLPPPAVPAEGGEGEPQQQGTGLVEQQELVTVGLTPAQVEVVKWVQNLDVNPAWSSADPSISLVLRAPADFIDENGEPRLPESPCTALPQPTVAPEPGASPAPEEPPTYRGCEVTDGVILSTLIDEYGVLFPALVDGDIEPDESPEATESPAP